MRPVVFAILVLALCAISALAHDIPNAQVDRSIQVTIRPGGLLIAYEITLSELTLTQDLRALIGTLPGADRREWFNEYGRIGGPLNAKGLLVSVDWFIGQRVLISFVIGTGYTAYGLVGSFIATMIWLYSVSAVLFFGLSWLG